MNKRNYHLRTERWRDVNGFEGLYQVSNKGRVKSVERLINYSDDRIYQYQSVIKKTSFNKGYVYVNLSKNSVSKSYKIHRLVAEAFIPNPDNKPQVEHIDTHRDNNYVWNLRWVTPKENQNNVLTIKHLSESQKGEKNKLYGKYGKEHHSSKPVLQYDLDGNFIREWECAMQIERELGINHSNVAACCRGRMKSCNKNRFKYKYDNNLC